ncbi:MAG: serine hydrolase [Pseudomonadota bacterium]
MTKPSRRTLLLGAGAALAAPTILRAQDAADALRAMAADLDQLHSLIVLRGGEPIIEEAFRGRGLDSRANLKSVSKTLVALLTGIAIDRGHIPSVEAPVLPLLGLPAFGDARDEMVLEDLLTLRAGLASTSGGNYGEWISSRDWVASALADPVGRPGERFVYSTGTFHVLGAAVARAANAPLYDLARDWLARPLNINLSPWVADPQGRYLGGNEMSMTPRELARIGQMIVQRGRWNGVQVVSEAWLDASFTPRSRSPFSGDAYGYGWFLTRFGGLQAAYARGYGGQILAVVPDADLVIAITSDPTRPARSGGFFGDLRRLLDQAAGMV